MKYTYTTPPGNLIKENLNGIINRKEFNAMPASGAAMGWTSNGEPIYLDIASAPHVLIAGSTGSGKSVLMHNMILSILFKNTPATAEIYLIDAKRIELSLYSGVPLVKDIITDPVDALQLLKALRAEMMNRYQAMEKARQRNAIAAGYKRIYVFIDELADLIYESKRETEKYISSIARLGRAAGIHLIIATQRPTRDVLTGQIKLNMPCRIALAVPAAVDSITILGHKGAEMLNGRGDALLMTTGCHDEIRFQSAYTSDADIISVVDYCSRQGPQKRHGWRIWSG